MKDKVGNCHYWMSRKNSEIGIRISDEGLKS